MIHFDSKQPDLYSTKIIMKMRWKTIATSVSMRTISPTATPLPKAYDCVAVYIAGRRSNLVVYGCRPKPTTKKQNAANSYAFKFKFKCSYVQITRHKAGMYYTFTIIVVGVAHKTALLILLAV